MDKTTPIIDGFLLTVGSVYSLANIRETLGIVILVIQLLWLLAKLVIRIVEAIKNKETFDEFDDDIENIIDTFDEVKDIISNEGDDEDGNSTKS